MIQDACLMFEVEKRAIHRHLNWPYKLDLPSRTLRGQQPLLWVLLEGDCPNCNGQHASISTDTYLMWHSYTPFECDHHGMIERVSVGGGPDNLQDQGC